MLLATLFPCVCPAWRASRAEEHACCAPEAGIHPAAQAGECCSEMLTGSPTLGSTPSPELAAPASAALAPRLSPAVAPGATSLPRAVSPSPPSVLRI